MQRYTLMVVEPLRLHSLRTITSACPEFNTGTDHHKIITSMGSGSDFSLAHMQPAHVQLKLWFQIPNRLCGKFTRLIPRKTKPTLFKLLWGNVASDYTRSGLLELPQGSSFHHMADPELLHCTVVTVCTMIQHVLV